MELIPLQLGLAAVFVSLTVLVIIVVALATSVQIVKPYERRTLTVLGKYKRTLDPGLNLVIPFVSSTESFDMRTQTLDVPRQEAITRDNSPVTADAVIYVRVMDAKKAFLEVDNWRVAVSNLAQTTLRAVLGDMELDETLNKRNEINARIREELDGPTDEWGVRVESVEVREVNPSQDVVNAMEQQTSAERRRRAMILEAQGERQSAIETAQGDKQSNIIRAQGKKQSQVLEAQGDAISTVLRAKSAESMGERAVIEKGLETLQAIGESPSTTYVIPQELSSMLSRYGKHLTDGDMDSAETLLDSLDFDAETREMLGLDNIEELIENLEDEVEKADSAHVDPDELDVPDAQIPDEGDVLGDSK